MILPAPSCLKGIHSAVGTKFVFETSLRTAIKVVAVRERRLGRLSARRRASLLRPESQRHDAWHTTTNQPISSAWPRGAIAPSPKFSMNKAGESRAVSFFEFDLLKQ
jgi:hypothetical protein